MSYCDYLLSYFLGAFPKLRKFHYACPSVRPVVCPHGTTRLPLGGLSWSFTFENFSKICRENSSLIAVWQEYLIVYMKSCVHLWYRLAKLFIELTMFQTKFVENVKPYILCLINSFRKSCCLWDDMAKYGIARYATNDNIIRSGKDAILMRDSYSRIQTHAYNIVTLIAFSRATMVTQTLCNVTLCVICLCLSSWQWEIWNANYENTHSTSYCSFLRWMLS
jgi:hypothetical protein